MKSRTIHIQDIGEIEMVKSQRASKLNITVRPFSGVRVSVPRFISFSKAESIVRSKADWIRKNQKKMSSFEEGLTSFDENSRFNTKKHTLQIRKTDRTSTSVTVTGGIIHVACPLASNIADTEIQKEIRKGIERALRKEAKEYLPGRVAYYAEKFGFSYRTVYLKNLKSRWGSCSSRGNINLNIHLMRLPDELIDFIILHELAHTVHQNHGKEFKSLLSEIAGDVKLLDKKLKEYKTRIY